MVKRAGVSPLTRKLLRDLREGWKSFAAIWIICTLAVTLYIGIDATWRGMDRNLNRQIEQGNMAHVWVYAEVSDRTARDLAALPGVADAQRRVLASGKAKTLAGEPTMALLMNDGEARINRPIVAVGSDVEPGQKDQCVLQQRFAEAQGLGVGDILRVELGERVLDLFITGLGTMPEYVVTHHGEEFSPTPDRFGYAYVSPGTLGEMPYTETVLTLAPDGDAAAVKQAAQDLLADHQAVVMERMDIFGIKMAIEEAQQLQALGRIFPVVFFVIAALITWTTMSRLVENQRLQIGTLFSQGYGRGELIRHYMWYGLLIAAGGSAAGIAASMWGVAPLILHMLGTIYVLPGVTPHLPLGVLTFMVLLLAGITGGASLLSAITALSQSPATLLRPKPPGKGKRIFLENIDAVWKRLRFSDKMILRNLLRNPVRLMMGLIGAIGCTAMLLTGFGMKDSVSYVMANHYSRTMHYEARVTLKADAPVNYGRSIALRAGADSYEEEMITTCEAFIGGSWQSKQVYVLEDEHEMIQLYDANKERLTLPESGVALTTKAAEDFGVTEGDPLSLRLPGGRAIHTVVTRVVDIQLDQGIYATHTAWKALHLSPWKPTAVLLRGAAMDLALAEDMDGVFKVRTLEQERNSNSNVLNIMDLVVMLMVVFSGALALVVLYNLGQLNFSERIRELATLMVLGFTQREMKRLVLRENIIIVCVGLPIGLLLGPHLHSWVLEAGLPNTIQFVPYIGMMSWIYTGLLTIAFALIVNWMLGQKFKQIVMVEALKSVE